MKKLLLSLGALSAVVAPVAAVVACGSTTKTLSKDVKVMSDVELTTANGKINTALATAVAAAQTTYVAPTATDWAADFTKSKHPAPTLPATVADWNVVIKLQNKGGVWADNGEVGFEGTYRVADSGNKAHEIDGTKDTYLSYEDLSSTNPAIRAVKLSEAGIDTFFKEIATGTLTGIDYSGLKTVLLDLLK